MSEIERAESKDRLYELIAESSLEFEKYEGLLSDLEETGYIRKIIANDDMVFYRAKEGLKWSDIYAIDDSYKKAILLPLIENPKTFFVLFNTQKGKLRIAGEEMSKWSNIKEKRIVTFLIVDNDKTLAEQSVNGLFGCFEKVIGHEMISKFEDKFKVKIFELSSNTKISLNQIITYIDAYAYNEEYYMPLILVLGNPKQMKKLIELLNHIKNHRNQKLASGIVWDEADKVYPQYRDKKFNINGNDISYIDFVQTDDKTIYRTGFVTATDGDLLEDKYEECMNAYHYPIDTSDINYRAIHHPDSKLHYIDCLRRDSNNEIAEKIINENWDTHFNKKYTLASGEEYYPKVIINSNSKGEDMKDFAKLMTAKSAYCMTFNQFGITLYTPTNETGKKYTTKKKRFGQVLFYIYKMNKLHDRTIFIIGRRKIDRGLGFHYAPRHNGPRITTIDGLDGFCITDGIEGLIWTDLILGNKLEELSTAVQKVGRGAGIIAQCPQYPKEFHYWTNQQNADDIIYHYNKVDNLNKVEGANTIIQAMNRALNRTEKKIRNHSIAMETFRVVKGHTPHETLRIIRNIVENIFNQHYSEPTKRDEFYITSLNSQADKVKLLDAIKKVPGSYGGGSGYRRFLPSYSNINNSITLYCVIPLIDSTYTQQQKDRLDEEYAANIVNVPQEGSLEHL